MYCITVEFNIKYIWPLKKKTLSISNFIRKKLCLNVNRLLYRLKNILISPLLLCEYCSLALLLLYDNLYIITNTSNNIPVHQVFITCPRNHALYNILLQKKNKRIRHFDSLVSGTATPHFTLVFCLTLSFKTRASQ